MNNLALLSYNDQKLIFRDPSLRIFFGLPIILFLVVLYFIPYLLGKFGNLKEYVGLFLMVGVIENTQLFSFIMSMVFLEEKESGVNRVYGILPFNKYFFILSRFGVPYLFTFILNVILLEIQPFIDITFPVSMLFSLVTAIIVPVFVLGVNVFSSNKLEGMVYVKVINILILLPFAGFFLPGSWKWIFAWNPMHWLMQAYDQMFSGENYLASITIAVALFVCCIIYGVRIFVRKHFV